MTNPSGEGIGVGDATIMETAEKALMTAGLSISRPKDGSLVIHLMGDWETGQALPIVSLSTACSSA